MNLKKRTIAVIGLGYVGLSLAVELGKKRPVIALT
jgi:UDP-N-acetyl-D-mannosaminuronate dehydrogenase